VGRTRILTAGNNAAAVAAVFLLGCFPSHVRAQDAPDPAAQHAVNAGANSQAIPRRPSIPSPDADARIQRWMRNVRPLQDRLIQDDRLRDTASIVGLGIAAYEASRGRPMVPLGAIGTGALRIGLSHQLTLFRQRSGYSVEPSIGRGSFAVTFRKRLDR
jgi:hypothetical protein